MLQGRKCLVIALLFLIGLIPIQTFGKGKFFAIWEKMNDEHRIWMNARWTSFENKWNEFNGENFRLIDIETSIMDGARVYSGVWVEGRDDYELLQNLDWDTFHYRWEQLKRKKLKLVDMEIYFNQAGQRKFVGVWLRGDDDQKILIDVNWDAFRAKWDALKKENYCLIDIETYVSRGVRKYAGIWEKGNNNDVLLHNLTQDNFKTMCNDLKNIRLTLLDMETYYERGTRRFIGLWGERLAAQKSVLGIGWKQFLTNVREFAGKSWTLVDFEITHSGSSSDNSSIGSWKNRIPSRKAVVNVETGLASFYSDKINGQPTASGELYNRDAKTGAHRSFPFGTVCRVTNLVNNKSVKVRINDRGPFTQDRIIDISFAAAKAIDLTKYGVSQVKVEVLKRPN